MTRIIGITDLCRFLGSVLWISQINDIISSVLVLLINLFLNFVLIYLFFGSNLCLLPFCHFSFSLLLSFTILFTFILFIFFDNRVIFNLLIDFGCWDWFLFIVGDGSITCCIIDWFFRCLFFLFWLYWILFIYNLFSKVLFTEISFLANFIKNALFFYLEFSW